jgi:glycosyltransferase involved in cell wall biosynthesis
MSEEPLVSIVTPCLNAARFLEETIESVLAQDYPRLEYIVMDGGSTDGTLRILDRYRGRLRWVTAADRGTADAVNQGFAASNGEIFAYLNADDTYLPGAVSTVVRALHDDREAGGAYGDAWWVNEAGERLSLYPVCDFDTAILREECFICQPASFVRRGCFENLEGLNPQFELAFDYDFWIRSAARYRMRRIPGALAESRMHRDNKSLARREDMFRESFSVLRHHYGYVPFRWIYAYVCFRADHRDQFFESFEPSILAYIKSLPVGLWTNRPRLARYLSEWFGVMTWDGLRRRLNDAR